MNPVQAGAMLPLLIAWPVFAALAAVALARFGCTRRLFDGFVIVAAGITLAGVALLIAPVLTASRISGSVPFGLGRAEFVADPVGLMFALPAALVWFCSTLYAAAWLRDDPAPVRYQVTSLVLLAANLGVVLAGDLMTLYVCFEVLGLVSLLLVIHDGSRRARRAGVKYFWMSLGGGISLLAGIFLFQALTGSDALETLPPDTGNSTLLWAAFGLLLTGFGVKAGMVPLHVWLPDAHPVAPPPASALLSGVMIKVGAYGIFRCLNVLFMSESGDQWALTAAMGLIVLWIGLITMLVGAILALGQQQAKRLLAWSSVSQMGFVLAGLGAGAYLGADGAMASAGGLLHIVNHGLFKGALFLGMGAVAMRAGTADLDRLGGLWRKMPVTFTAMLVATAGVTGVPLFNGFASKSMIHHGIVQAGEQAGGPLALAEWIFLAASAGTVAYFVKLIAYVFMRRPEHGRTDSVREAPAPMLAAMLLLAVPIVLLGWRPDWLLQGLVEPGLSALMIPVEPIAHFLSRYFLSPGDSWSFALTAFSGGILAAIGMRFGLFRVRAPAWVGVDYWYRAAGLGFIGLCRRLKSAITAVQSPGRVLSAGLGRKIRPLLADDAGRIEHAEDRFFRRLDRVREDVRARAEALALEPSELSAGEDAPEDDRRRLLNAVHWLSGLLVTRMIEHAMSAFAHAADRRELEQWLSACEERTGKLARSSLTMVRSCSESSQIDAAMLERAWRDVLPPLPVAHDTAQPTLARQWADELKALVTHPRHRHWPVTESLDRGRLVSMLRWYLKAMSRDLELGLALVFVMLASAMLLLLLL